MAENASRPNPDELLARVKTEEAKKQRGRLKIFLGYAAGVGKTYAMLEAARQRMNEVDIVVGLVETHGRPETKALLEGFDTIPRRKVEYRGMVLEEMDLDAVLARHPQLALVDELAHTNAPESRHPKRYQDVEELLEAGIDVYTTLNIQHVESLRSVVAQVTSVWVRETVPDTVIEGADEIELVDLPPEELLKRLKEGKVYVPEQIERATEEFFRKGNLTALRELTMRTGAQRVDEQMRDYMGTHAIRGPWTTSERIMVCIKPGSHGLRLVSAGRRLATQIGARWFVVYVETPTSPPLKSGQHDRLMNAMRMAERQGARIATIQGESALVAITDFASRNSITKIVIGKSQRKLWQRLLVRSLADRLVDRSQFYDVYVVAAAEEQPAPEAVQETEERRNRSGYLKGLGLIILATLVGEGLHNVLSEANLIMIYLLCVVITAVFWGLGPSILASVMGVLAFDFFFIPPLLAFDIKDTEYFLTFVGLLLVGVVISYLTSRVREQTEAARHREQDASMLYTLSRTIALTLGREAIINAILKSGRETFERDVVVFLPDGRDPKSLKPVKENAELTISDNDIAAAAWAFEHQKEVGTGTDTLPAANALFVPLNTSRGAIGVMAVRTAGARQLTTEQTHLLEAFADLAALAIERTQLAEQARNARILEATEKLQSALLNSISHDLRTPLVSIIGVLSSLQDVMGLDKESGDKLIEMARSEAERLNHLITNLLDMSRIEAGALRLSKRPSDVQDIVGVALEQLHRSSGDRQIETNLPRDLPFVSVDFGLAVEVFVNILDNAFKYSPPGTPVEINGRRTGKQVEIEIADRGIGIPAQDLVRVFDKFYRVQRPDNVAGTGLGLSICKGIVEAHGGQISAENRPGGGTVIRLSLPAAEALSEDKKVHEPKEDVRAGG